MQHLLGRAKWDADQVRDDVSDYVVEHLHDDEAGLVGDHNQVRGVVQAALQRQRHVLGRGWLQRAHDPAEHEPHGDVPDAGVVVGRHHGRVSEERVVPLIVKVLTRTAGIAVGRGSLVITVIPTSRQNGPTSFRRGPAAWI